MYHILLKSMIETDSLEEKDKIQNLVSYANYGEIVANSLNYHLVEQYMIISRGTGVKNFIITDIPAV